MFFPRNPPDHFHLQLQRLFLWTELEQWNGQSLCSCSVPMSSNALYNKNIYSHSLHHHWEVSSLVLLNHQYDTLVLRTSVFRHVRILSHLHPQELPHLSQIYSKDLSSILYLQSFPSAAPSPLPLPRGKWYRASARKLSSKPQMDLYLFFIALCLYPNWSISVFISKSTQLSTLWFPVAGFYHSTGIAVTCLSSRTVFSRLPWLSTVKWELMIKS